MTAPADGVGLRVLIVEDNSDCADSMAFLLSLYGYEVAIAGDGPSALTKVQADKPDVVLLDLALPGMSGYEVARQLIESRPRKTPLIIAVTGFGRDEDRQRSEEAGIDLHLVKPVEPEQLHAILERFRQLLAGETA